IRTLLMLRGGHGDDVLRERWFYTGPSPLVEFSLISFLQTLRASTGRRDEHFSGKANNIRAPRRKKEYDKEDLIREERGDSATAQAPAKGGLPPVPDFVKRKATQNQENTDLDQGLTGQGLVTFRTPQEAVGEDAKILLQPTMGVHRPSSNAVFAFAEGYDLKVYATFIESLKQTGFAGDVVLAVSDTKKMKTDVFDY
ncbi:hypothetical protein THAOC_26827, partial [Thalassiosira oceanica]